MDLEIIVLSEVSLTTTNTYDIIYMWNLKQNNKLIENRKTDYGHQRWGKKDRKGSKGTNFQI